MKKTMIALLSLTLTGAMSCPAFAAVTDAPSIISDTSATDDAPFVISDSPVTDDAPFVISGSPVTDETLLISPNPLIDCNTLSEASKIYTAIWTRNNHSYSISSQSGLSRNKILKLIQKIR